MSNPDLQPAGDLGAELARRIRQIADGAEQLRTSEGFWPLVTGSLMDELAHESEFAAPDPWGAYPILAARNLASTSLVAAIDYVRAFASTVESHQPFAPFLTARAALEAASVSCYLSEQGIGPRERVRRLVNERLQDIYEHQRIVRRLDLSSSSQELAENEARVQLLIQTGVGLGLAPVQGSQRSPFALDTPRPSATALITEVFRNDLGPILYHVMSSPSHSRPQGLLHSVKVGDDSPLAPLMGQISLTGKDVTLMNSACVLAMGQTIDALARMNGWQTNGWREMFLDNLRFAQEVRIQEWGE